MWEIIDNNGTIHAGNEDEMRKAFDVMTTEAGEYRINHPDEKINKYAELIEKWVTTWDGDLKLIQIHNISR